MTGEVNLATWAGAVMPAGAWPSSENDDVVRRLRMVLEHDHPQWEERLAALANRMAPHDLVHHADDRDVRWFAGLVGQVAVTHKSSWRALGWTPSVEHMPEGTDIPDEVVAAVVDRRGLLGRYDAIVIGSGAGGGVAAQELSEAGRTVLVVERGGAPPTGELARDHLRSPTAHSRVGTPDPDLVGPSDPRWGASAFGLGGGTRVYGAQAWRFAPQDFAMASTYGEVADSGLADWPVSYDEMEPYYALAEFEWGVSGAPGPPGTEGHRSVPFPLPPLPRTKPASALLAGAEKLGWRTLPTPMLINSEPYRGRAACVRCSQCLGFACPVGAKAGSQNTALWRASRTGRTSFVLSARVVELVTTKDGTVTGALIRGVDDQGPWERRIDADEIVIAAGAVESARLLLSSRSAAHPHGLGNGRDQVGRYLQGQAQVGAIGIFEDAVTDLLGPGAGIATADFRHGNAGLTGGGILTNDYVPTPASALRQLQGAGLLPFAGPDLMPRFARLLPRLQRIMATAHEVPMADARVTLDIRVKDEWGIPIPRLHGDLHAEDVKTRNFLSGKAARWLHEAGASQVVRIDPRSGAGGPVVSRFQAGTARMGTDEGSSVVDPWGRLWGHANVRVVDAATHVSNGGATPVLTTVANAYRVMADMVGASKDEDGFDSSIF
ncbi:GMC family oxidoreductase [Demequina sp. B12]|uniref:GMC oxidoreductase n=1 Tax=Demequina sp. B12 TaxID=2992757 RepID=UPI00237B1D28|nr:GMC family oxidoreductase [Demequina sp. B12]MDE0572206.1 GMC family oxidoreductase [Demequina sp. B12]